MWSNKRLWLGGPLPELVIRRNGRSIRDGVHRKAIPSLGLLCLRSQTFFFGLGDPRSFRFRPLWVIALCFRLFFCSVLPEISTSAVLHDLLRSFRVEAPIRSVTPAWNLLKVLEFLKSPVFEPLHQASLRDLTRKTLILTALASAKRVSELQALSRTVSFSSSAATVSYVPEFIAKTESALRPLPRSFDIQSLSDFAAGLPDEMLLCPVRSLSEYVARTSRFVSRPRRLFVSPRNPSRAMLKKWHFFFITRSYCTLWSQS